MRQRFVPSCADLERRLALSAAFGSPAAPPAVVTPPPATTPTDTDPTDTATDPGDGITVAIKAFPTNTGSTSTPTLPA
jgi:hypothetical protein